MARKIIGALLLLLCFGVILAIVVYAEGLKIALLIFGIAVALMALIDLGAWLLT